MLVVSALTGSAFACKFEADENCEAIEFWRGAGGGGGGTRARPNDVVDLDGASFLTGLRVPEFKDDISEDEEIEEERVIEPTSALFSSRSTKLMSDSANN